MNFKQLGIDESILRALNEMGYTNPTPIQQKALSPIKDGKDLLCCANDEMGKTMAFSVPMLQKMGKPESLDNRPIKSIVLAPNRQSAMQIYGNICQCGRYMGRIAAVIYSGASQIPQIEAINRGADILVATPLRLIEFLEKNLIKLDDVEYFVICDANKMFERGLLNDIRKIKSKLPKKHQTMLFAENLSSEIRAFAQKMLYRPFRIDMSVKKHRTNIASPKERIQKVVRNKRKTENKPVNISVVKQEKPIKPSVGKPTAPLNKINRINDEFKMDISTPRTAKLSDEAAARVKAKVQAKLKEREEARRKANKNNNAASKKPEENKKPIRRYNRTRGRGNRKQITKE